MLNAKGLCVSNDWGIKLSYQKRVLSISPRETVCGGKVFPRGR